MNSLQNSTYESLSNEELFLISNYKQCPVHPKRKISCLSMDCNSKYFLKCMDCLTLSADKNFIPLLSLLDSDKKTIFKSWPVINDTEFYDELIDISQRKSFAEETKQQIITFFKQFRSQIDQVLEEKQLEMITHTDSLWDINEKVINQYNQLSAKDELKDIILNKRDNFEKQNKILGDTISRVLHNQEGNKKAILDSILHLKNQIKTIDFELPNQIKKSIIQQVKDIDLFLIKNLEDIKISKPIKNIVVQQAMSDIHSKDMTTSQLVIKLMNNKLNNCSEDILNQLNQVILSVEGYLNKTSVTGLETLNILELDKLSPRELKNVQSLTQRYLENKSVGADNNNLFEERINKKERMMKLISNRFNFCTQEFINQISAQFDYYDFILEEIDFENITQQGKQYVTFGFLSEKQIEEIQNIVQSFEQINQLNQRNQNLNLLSEPTNFIDQFNKIFENKLSYYDDSFFQNSKLVTEKYPEIITTIYQLNKPVFKNLTNSIDFIKTNFRSSQELTIQNENGKVKLIQKFSLRGQIVTQNKLDENTNYIFRCQVNKKLDLNYLSFGIIQQKNIHEDFLSNELLCFRTGDKNYGLDSIVKGSNMYDIRNQIDGIEVRVNLKKKILMFADYPNYQNINQSNQEKIRENCDYVFGVGMNTPGSDVKIDISSFISTDFDAFINFK